MVYLGTDSCVFMFNFSFVSIVTSAFARGIESRELSSHLSRFRQRVP